MLVLAAADTLQGVADAANKVTYSIFGMTLVNSVEAYSCLAQGQFSNSAGAIYTAPNPGQAFIKTIHVANTDTASHTFQLFRGGAASANALTATITLAAGYTALYEDGEGWTSYSNTMGFMQGTAMTNTGYHPGVMGTSGCKGATFDRSLCPEVNTTITTTGQVYMEAIWLPAGTVVSNIKIWSATTPANGPTHYNAGLYDTSGNRLCTGTDKTNTAWAANTLTTFAMQAPYTVPTTGLYYVAYSMTASTAVITVKGTTARTNGNLSLAGPILSGVSATAYSTGDMPNTLAIPNAAVLTSLYAEVT
jgi:hypothetical protein